MALQRRRTLQGGDGRSLTYGGVANSAGRGILNQFLGGNPIPRQIRRTIPRLTNSRQRVPLPPIPGRGARPGIGGRDRPNFPRGNPNAPGQGSNPPPGQGGMVPGLGLPLDALFERERGMADDARTALLAQLANKYQTDLSQIGEQSMLANRGLDSDMAARGLFGSGVERRGERLIGNEDAKMRLGALGEFTSGQSGAEMDYQRMIQEAMLGLASRMQSDDTAPLPQAYGRGGNPNPNGRARRKRPNAGRSIPRRGRGGGRKRKGSVKGKFPGTNVDTRRRFV